MCGVVELVFPSYGECVVVRRLEVVMACKKGGHARKNLVVSDSEAFVQFGGSPQQSQSILLRFTNTVIVPAVHGVVKRCLARLHCSPILFVLFRGTAQNV